MYGEIPAVNANKIKGGDNVLMKESDISSISSERSIRPSDQESDSIHEVLNDITSLSKDIRTGSYSLMGSLLGNDGKKIKCISGSAEKECYECALDQIRDTRSILEDVINILKLISERI